MSSPPAHRWGRPTARGRATKPGGGQPPTEATGSCTEDATATACPHPVGTLLPSSPVPQDPLFGVTPSRPARTHVGQEGDLDSKVLTGGGCEVTQLSPPLLYAVLPPGQGGKYEVIVFSFQNNRFCYSPGVEVAAPGSLCVWRGGVCPPRAEPWHGQRCHGCCTLVLAASGPGGEKRGVRGCGRGVWGQAHGAVPKHPQGIRGSPCWGCGGGTVPLGAAQLGNPKSLLLCQNITSGRGFPSSTTR